MVRIIGRKILMPKGDDGIFKLIILDPKGKEINLSSEDKITLRMKYTMESNLSLSKTAHVIHLDEKFYHIIKFNSSDTSSLLEGDYYYDVIIERDNKRFTVVPTSIFTLEKSISLEDLEDDLIETIDLFNADTLDYDDIMSITPLIGSFNAVHYKGNSLSEEVEEEIQISSTLCVTALSDDIIEF